MYVQLYVKVNKMILAWLQIT